MYKDAMNELKTNKDLNRVFSLSSALGIFPLHFDPDNVSISYKALAASILIRVTLLAGVIHLGTWEFSSSAGNNIDKICTVIQYSATFACTIYMIRNKNDFALLQLYFCKVDIEFKNLGITPRYKVEWSRDASVLVLALFSSLVVPLSMRYDELSIDDCFETLLETFVVWQSFVMVQPFVQCVRIVGDRFSNVREVFTASSQSKHEFYTKDKLESTIRIYNMLCNTSELLIDLFSIQLLFLFFLVLLKVILAAFRLLLTIKHQSKIFDFIFHCLVLTYHAVVCIYTTAYCKKTSEEADEFNNVLNELMIDENSTSLSDNGKLRLHVIMKREVTFNVLGFLNLDYTLVHSIIAAATTYLVILLQFTEEAPSSTPPVRSPNYPY